MDPRKLACLTLALCCNLSACKGSPTSSRSNTPIATGTARSTVQGPKLSVKSADVGKPEELVAWLFGPLDSKKRGELGTASTVGSDGGFSFPTTLEAGSYHLQVGHTWASPRNIDTKEGKTLRLLDYPLKLSGGQAPSEGAPADATILVTVDAKGVATIPSVTITGEPFSLDWDTKKFVPKNGEELTNRIRVEFNVVGHPAAHEVKVAVRKDADGKGAELYSATAIGGRVLWSGVEPGTYSYRVSSVLVSSKTLETPWINFSVKAP
jgi:hypothetical protein